MSSVMQEKTNRIVEVMVSSVKPFELMIGKITSIGLVGLTQLGIWILFIIGIFLSVGAIFSFSGGMDTANIENMTAVAGSMNGVDAAQLKHAGKYQSHPVAHMFRIILYRRLYSVCFLIRSHRIGSRQ